MTTSCQASARSSTARSAGPSRARSSSCTTRAATALRPWLRSRRSSPACASAATRWSRCRSWCSTTRRRATRTSPVCRARAASAAGSGSARAGRRSTPDVGDAIPTRLGRELDRLAAAVRLHVHEGVDLAVERDVELALLDALIEPGAAEDETSQPVHQRALGRADELGPALVDVLAQRRCRLGDLAVDDQVDQILGLILLDGAGEEAELAGRLLTALAEVTLVEREPQLAVLEDEVIARAVVTASVHERRDHMLESSPPV